jgi:seryl-tRNA synthetase
MLDLKEVLAAPDKVQAALVAKKATGPQADLSKLRAFDEERRKVIFEAEELQRRKNALAKSIGPLMGKLKGPATDEEKKALTAEIERLKVQSVALDEQLKNLNDRRAVLQTQVDEILAWLPNIPQSTVPVGEDASANVVVREWDQGPKPAGETPPHWETGQALGLLDLARGAKVSGSGWYFLRGAGARMERALVSWFLDVHTQRHGYEELLPPFFVSEKTLFGSGQLPKFREQMYFAEADGLFAIPTAEVPVTAFFGCETLAEDDLPKKFAAYSGCFRREAGAAGADTRGILRVHQFNKVELLKLVHPASSFDELEKLTADAEYLLRELGLRHRVLSLCTGDLGFASAKTYDLEVWSPGVKKWLEVSSCSNFESFQARRLNIRFKPKDGGKPEFVHTLNGSGLALPRIQIAIWETYLQPDGSLTIPSVLRPYMGGLEKIEPQR